MTFPAYPEYKDSDDEWLGKVPSHWVKTRIKHTLSFMGSGGTPETSNVDYWANSGEEGHFWVAIGDMSDRDFLATTSKKITENGRASKKLQIWPKGTLLFSMYASLGHVVELHVPAATNQAILALVPNPNTDQSFLKRWFQFYRPHLGEFASSNTQDNLNAEKVSNLVFLCPPLNEQRSIANFLDHETAKIDALIAEQEKLIDLLNEKRQSVISNAVCRGLDSNVPMKDSGVEWLGMVPEHWHVLPLKRFFKLIVDVAPNDNDFELLSLYTGIGVRPRKELEARGNRASTTDGYFKVAKGDIVVNKLLAWMGAIGISEYDGVTSPAYDILRAQISLSSHYYDYLFRCGLLNTEFRRYSRGIMDMRLRLYFEEFGQFLMPFPPYEEQLKIVQALNNMLDSFDKLGSEASKAIELLQERRSALISAAVTGQIDVRNHQ